MRRREEIGAMRRNVRPDLEDDLLAVVQGEPARIDVDASSIPIDTDRTVECEEPRRPEPLPPRAEEVAERRASAVVDDAGGLARPAADRGRDEDDAAVGEELEVHALRGDALHAAHVWRRRVVARADSDRRGYRHLALIVAVLGLAGCGGGGGAPPGVSVQAAHTYSLVAHHSGSRLSLKIVQPDGTPLTKFKTGSGPHTGVHVIVVRRDLSAILHVHPPVRADGVFTASVATLPPGPYRVVVDVYPADQTVQPNFQLFSNLTVAGRYSPRALPQPQQHETVDGFTFTLHGTPHLRAIQPAFLHFTVTAPGGKAAAFTPWFGALAHAIFFRAGSLDYFHTHVCAPGAAGCTSILGAAKVTGTSSTPGSLDVGVLVPVSGTWRLFLQCRVDGHVLTAPFTLHVG
jgi:hypothetical protein